VSTPHEVLRLERVNKWFLRGTPRAVHVLKDVEFRVTRGEVLVVIGPSGSGKSTLLRCINLIAPPDTGSVTFLGREWRAGGSMSLNPLARRRERQALIELRQGIGMVFQHFNLFPHLTALENVALAPRLVGRLSARDAREDALAELERVGLGHFADSYPSRLSGGQKQRVAIARALATRPQIMLFDEVTSALDPELIGGVLEEMKKLARAGMTMIVVTHEMGFAREVGHRVVFMDYGQILEQGSTEELLLHPTNPRTQMFLRAIV
jgi:ABC-type polar amino acid transport system ATPase subunit